MEDNKNFNIPNYFYDLIVFVSPSILLIIGFLFGMPKFTKDLLNNIKGNLGAIDFILVILLILFMAYEYGRFAEALSHTFVSRMIDLLKKIFLIKKLFKSIDYNTDFSSLVADIELPIEIQRNKHNNKWTIYFYALLVSPSIGQDLLKRYAWEKLSRSSAFTFEILFFTSIIHSFFSFLGLSSLPIQAYSFGSYQYTSIVFVFSFCTAYEYYRRKCWNNDLLFKIFPILKMAQLMEK